MRELRKVLDLIAQLRDEGNAVILITHNMEHVVELADRAVVLRQGREVGQLKPTRVNQRELVAMIVGGGLKQDTPLDRAAGERIVRFATIQ